MMPEAVKPPLILPRPLIFLASLWLIGSWMVAIGFNTPIQPSSASYTPGVRMMLTCVTIGLLIGWPLLRLSQRATHYPLRQTMLDLILLIAMMQVVIWPLKLVTPWATSRMAAIDGLLVGWVLLIGGIVAAAVGSSRSIVRTFGMIACITLTLFGPAMVWIGQWLANGTPHMVAAFPRVIAEGPFVGINRLSFGGSSTPLHARWIDITVVGLAALTVWLLLILLSMIRSRTESHALPAP